MAAEALGMLAHVSSLGARLWRRDQAGEHALVSTDGSLEWKKRRQNQSALVCSEKREVCSNENAKKLKKVESYPHSIPQAWREVTAVAHWRHSHSLRTTTKSQ